MSDLIIRDVSPEVLDQLTRRAGREGRSPEDLARALLSAAVRGAQVGGGLGTELHRAVMAATGGEGASFDARERSRELARVPDIG